MALNNSMTKALLKQNMQRIIQLEPTMHQLINTLDLGISNIYEKDETLKSAELLATTLGQIDSDLSALIALLDE